jgi:mycothiol synthase
MSHRQTLPILPVGFTIRAPGDQDLDACVTLLERCSEVKQGSDRITDVELRGEWNTPGAALDRNFRVIVDPTGRMVAYMEAWDVQNPPVSIWTWGRVDPDFEGLGLGTALMAWAEEVARAAVDRCPPHAEVVMRAGAVNGYGPACALFEDLGLSQVRQFQRMEIRFDGSPPAPPIWPEGIQLRPYRHPEDLAAVVQADQEAFRDHWGFMERSHEEELAYWRHVTESDPHFDPAYWFVAVDGHEIAGICLCSPSSTEAPDLAYIRIVGVRRPWRRRGLASALLQHVFTIAHDAGQAGVTLGVDSDNISGATRLYTRAGMKPTRVVHVYEKKIRPGISLLNPG